MRRLIALSVLPAALLALSTGCKTTTGVCDCGEHPGQGVPIHGHSSYEPFPGPIGGHGAVPTPPGALPVHPLPGAPSPMPLGH